MTSAGIHDERTGDEGTPLCLGCLAPIPGPGPCHFCSRCGTPLTSYATSAPLEQVWSFGWMVSRLLSRRPTSFVVAGTVLLAVPALIMLAAALVGFPFLLESGGVGGRLTDLLGWGPALIVELLYIALVVRVLRSYFRRREPGTA